MSGPWEKYQTGAIDLARPRIENADGSFSTERTIGIEVDGRYYNIPTIVNGQQLSEDDAVSAWRTGRNPEVGVFATQADADAAAPNRSERIGQVRDEGPWTKYGAAPNDQPREAEDIVRGVRSSMANGSADEGVSVIADVARSGASGLASGAAQTLALPNSLLDLAKTGIDYAAENLLPDGAADTYSRVIGTKADERVRKGREQLSEDVGLPMMQTPAEAATALSDALPRAETTAGEYARTIGEFAPGVLAGPGGVARRAAAQVLAPAVTSETAGQITEGTEAEPYARIAGAAIGALAPSAASRAITPFPINAERRAMVDTLRAEGVPLSAGQVSGNRGLQYAESLLADVPFASGRARDLAERQGDAFSTAAMRRVGETEKAVPDTVKRARDRIGQGFEDISSRNQIVADPQFVQDFQDTLQRYARILPAQQKEPFINTAGDLMDRMANGAPLSGRDYQDIRSLISSAAHSTTDHVYGEAMRGLRNALDNAFSRQVRPEDAADLKKFRKQYGNLKTIEKAVTGAGENAALGRLSPAQLRGAVAQGKGRGAYARGEGDFADLARAGQAVMTPLPNSGTAQRVAIQGGLASLAGGNMSFGNFPAAVASYAVPALASRAVHSRPGQAYLSNQVMAALEKLPPQRRAAVAAILAAQQARVSPPAAAQ